ncbi:hypothetical protein [Streptomyces roseolus]|uniref:hypothetical protein n=1 Tax=Streptomyces roseolus TaxID=67358 RepID=UPI0037AE2FCC
MSSMPHQACRVDTWGEGSAVHVRPMPVKGRGVEGHTDFPVAHVGSRDAQTASILLTEDADLEAVARAFPGVSVVAQVTGDASARVWVRITHPAIERTGGYIVAAEGLPA